MSKIAVVYWSGTGNTEIMANKIAEGARENGNTVELFTPADFSSDKLSGFDIIAMGCPSMGAEVLEESEFQPMYDDMRSSLRGKRVAVFGSYGWGDGEWIRNWQEDLDEACANIVCDFLMINGTPDDAGEAECVEFGKKLG